jgi:hypothetical protein
MFKAIKIIARSRYFLSLPFLAFSCVNALAATVAMPTASGPRNFETDQFASGIVAFQLGNQSFTFAPGSTTNGPFTNANQFAGSVLGHDLSNGLTVAGAPQDFVTLKFPTGGSIIYLWEAGDLSDIGDTHIFASIDGGASFSALLHIGPLLQVTQPLDHSSSFNTNVAVVNATAFGLPRDAHINAVKISSATSDHVDILAVAAIPEPRVPVFIALGVVILLVSHRRLRL